MSKLKLTPELLLAAYVQGIFPMSHQGELFWYDPDPRAILPLHEFHISRSLKRVLKRVWICHPPGSRRPLETDGQNRSKKPGFEIYINRDFKEVIKACANPIRPGAWINDEIIFAYLKLHELGWAHSVETWQQGRLVGGLYGVAVRGLFAGEAMFSQVTDASKVALVYLVERMVNQGFSLLDVQFETPHLARFGVRNIPRTTYKQLLARALNERCTFV